MSMAKRIVLLISPLLATPLIGFLIAENYLSFGGGDKDIVILIPWIAWAFILIFSGIFLWKRTPQFKTWAFKSFIYSVVVSLVVWLCLLMGSVATTL